MTVAIQRAKSSPGSKESQSVHLLGHEYRIKNTRYQYFTFFECKKWLGLALRLGMLDMIRYSRVLVFCTAR